jgi:hypothetical protein
MKIVNLFTTIKRTSVKYLTDRLRNIIYRRNITTVQINL